MYLNFTRPDITYPVQQLSQFLSRPSQSRWKAALHVLRYLKGSPSKGIFFPVKNDFRLEAFSDADWASCCNTRRSLSGFCIKLGDALISLKTKKQATGSRSSAEVKYRSLASTVCELKWISYLLKDFGISPPLPIPYGAIIKLLCTSLPILCFTYGQNTSRSIAMSFTMNSKMVLLSLNIFLLLIN